MTSAYELSGLVQDEVSGWEGVVTRPHRFGGIEFRLGRRELGHLHLSNAMLDVPFAKKIREVVVAEGRAGPHHVLPETGWITFYVTSEEEVEGAVWLLRLSYLFHLARQPNQVPSVKVSHELAALRLSPALDAVFDRLSARRRLSAGTESES